MKPQTEERRYLRIAEAAEYLGATPWFVRTLIWTKAIPFIPMGKRHVLDRQDLDAYIENAKVGTA
jgi:excisionase family DNA binding protein